MKQMIWLFCLCAMPLIGHANGAVIGTERKNAVTDRSKPPFLTASLTEGKLLMKLPRAILGQPILWTRVGQANQYETKQIIFTRIGNDIIVEEPRIWSETGIWIPLGGDPSVEKHILGVFPIVETRGNGYLFDATGLFLGDRVPWKRRGKGPGVAELTRISDVRQLEGEVMVKASLGVVKDGASISQPIYYSFYGLPEPMAPRRYDFRMGFSLETGGVPQHRFKNVLGSIARWRLQKKFSDRDLSRPVRPIIFVMSPNIPKKWRPFVKAGVEEWLPAFEYAGFRDALVVKEVEALDEWEEFSLGRSVIKWSGNQNIRKQGYGRAGSTITKVVDLRSGEIIKSDILLGSSYEHLMDQYFIRCAALDPRAHEYPFPDDLLGHLIQSLVAHETGHTLGIRDNHYGEYSYPLEKMGDTTWLRKMGHTPSIMTYARHNNVARPEDGVPPPLLIQKVGPTDRYYIRWAYMEFDEGMSSKEKDDGLERIIRSQDSVPWYRYNHSQYETIGPAATNEVVETNDPVGGTVLALENLKGALELLPGLNQGEKDNTRMERIYAKALELWYYNIKHVLSLIGGYEIFYKSMDQPGGMYTPIPLESQERALDFLMGNAFDPPDWLSHPSFSTKTRYSTYPDQVLGYQQKLLLEMLRAQRMKRLEHMETIDGYGGVLQSYLARLQGKLFKELEEGPGIVDPRRQEIQMIYIERLVWAIDKERKHFEPNKKAFDHTDYTRGLMKGQLRILGQLLENHLKRGAETGSKGHWERCLGKLGSFPRP